MHRMLEIEWSEAGMQLRLTQTTHAHNNMIKDGNNKLVRL